MQKVSFTRMDQGTPEDFALLLAHEEAEKATLPDRILALLRTLDVDDTGYQVTRFEHSLQAATRARRDGADEDLVICALLHDVGDLVAPDHHAAFAATLLEPYVSAEHAWIVRHHGLFQGYYYAHHWGGDRHAREALRGHDCFDACAAFCERYDQVSFDPAYDSLPLEAFEASVRAVFTRAPFDPARLG